MDETSWRQAGSAPGTGAGDVQPQVVVLPVLHLAGALCAQALAGERPAGVLMTDCYAVT